MSTKSMTYSNTEATFHAEYARARSITVFWCPTIFRDPSEREHFLSRFLAGGLQSESVERKTLIRQAKMELIEYFNAFTELKGKAKDFIPLLNDTFEKAAATGVKLKHGLYSENSFLVDFAPSAKYKELVKRMGKPVLCRPSLGIFSEVSTGLADLTEVGLNLEFQIEASYTSLLEINAFLAICHEFLRECRQYALLVDLTPGGAWKLRSPDHEKPFEQPMKEKTWSLYPTRSKDVHYLPHLIRDRLRNHLALQTESSERAFIGNVAQRWIHKARIRNQDSFGATIELALNDDAPLRVRSSGFSHWLFEALFLPCVRRPRIPDKELHEEDKLKPPDPILLSIDSEASAVRFAIYENEPPLHRCLCGNEYPVHEGEPSVVSLRKKAKDWIERQYPRGRHAGGMDWRTLSAPRTYLNSNPEEIWSQENSKNWVAAVKATNRFWRRLLTTFFEAYPLQGSAGDSRESL